MGMLKLIPHLRFYHMYFIIAMKILLDRFVDGNLVFAKISYYILGKFLQFLLDFVFGVH